jgi:hypothetical protein
LVAAGSLWPFLPVLGGSHFFWKTLKVFSPVLRMKTGGFHIKW